LAEILKPSVGNRLWAVDRILLAYIVFTTILILGWWNSVPGAAWRTALHLIAGAVLILEVKRPNPTSWIFRNWYPLPYVAYSYKEMALLVPAVRRSDRDQWLANLDFRIWHANPTVWLERIQTPFLTELFQIVYTLFVPAVLLAAALLWRKRRYTEFRYYAFLIALGFLLSYVGYLLVPARGPRFLLRDLQHLRLQGLWLFHSLQDTLDRLESAQYDCFPSGHTELTILAWWGSRWVSKRWFWVYFAYTPTLIFATVYLRYHYSVDVFAGAALAFILILVSPSIYRKLS